MVDYHKQNKRHLRDSKLDKQRLMLKHSNKQLWIELSDFYIRKVNLLKDLRIFRTSKEESHKHPRINSFLGAIPALKVEWMKVYK